MKHFYQDIYNLYRVLEAQDKINNQLILKIDDLEQRIKMLENVAKK